MIHLAMHRRREFLGLSLLAPAAALIARRADAQAAPPVAMRAKLYPEGAGPTVAQDFIGLSYESAVLSDPTFFAPDNFELIGFIRRLCFSGVLRIGGNTSAYSVWVPSGAVLSQSSQQLGPDKGREKPPRRPVTPQAIRNLRGFLEATGWRLIYGLNIGTADPETASDEAATVWKEMGDKLAAFQLGNEPDLFRQNGVRKRDYDFGQFAAEWRRYHAAIRQRVPRAPLAGPDTAVSSEWLAEFAREFAFHLQFLSQHYYAEGPPGDPAMTTARLLASQNAHLETLLDGIMTAHTIVPATPFRLTETNSCYEGGKPGVSDVFAAALWGVDLMLRMAATGVAGINFHGGGNSWYTPIAGTRDRGFLARPLYYGMLLFAQAGPKRLLPLTIDNSSAARQFVAYGLLSNDGSTRIVLINKHSETDVDLMMEMGAAARVLRLTAPSPDDTQHTTLGGARVSAGGSWSPAAHEFIAPRDGAIALRIPRSSAVLMSFA